MTPPREARVIRLYHNPHKYGDTVEFRVFEASPNGEQEMPISLEMSQDSFLVAFGLDPVVGQRFTFPMERILVDPIG